MTRSMLELDDQQQAARDWFESLRDRICAAFEQIERETGSDAAFVYTPWDRSDATGEVGGCDRIIGPAGRADRRSHARPTKVYFRKTGSAAPGAAHSCSPYNSGCSPFTYRSAP